MDDEDQAVSVGQGIKVFGSAIERVAPDSVSIVMAVSRLEKQPKEAFAQAHAGARAVHDYLKKAAIDDVGSSRITLTQEEKYVDGDKQLVGYKARLGYSIIVRDLDGVEDLLTGLIDAGANELTSVSFETSRLKEVRELARKRAILAARDKAAIYANALDVSVGGVTFIEDQNPEQLSGRFSGDVRRRPSAEDSGELKAIDPGAITVAAAVNVVFEIKR